MRRLLTALALLALPAAATSQPDPARIDWSTNAAANYTLRQDSGPGNALGQVRIDMPNHLAVYMHDTPSKGLFSSDNRFHSSGCVRVDKVAVMIDWILQGQDGIDTARHICLGRDTAIVFLTAQSDEATLARALEVSPFGFLVKPFRARELKVAIEVAVTKQAKDAAAARECADAALNIGFFGDLTGKQKSLRGCRDAPG